LKDWIPRFKSIKKSVVELSGDFTPDVDSLNNADIIVTTPEKWDGITRSKDR
jgi:activating signal cointegrator complex subunit 3